MPRHTVSMRCQDPRPRLSGAHAEAGTCRVMCDIDMALCFGEAWGGTPCKRVWVLSHTASCLDSLHVARFTVLSGHAQLCRSPVFPQRKFSCTMSAFFSFMCGLILVAPPHINTCFVCLPAHDNLSFMTAMPQVRYLGGSLLCDCPVRLASCIRWGLS